MKNIKFEKIIKNEKFIVFIMSAVIGLLIFIAIYGVRVINPQYISWIYKRGTDMISHYVGWCYYRNTPWRFPIGQIDGLIYPYSTSIVYTDSIPLFAILFKVLSPILPEHFQYFGLWGVACFSLQGGFAGLILKKYIDNNIYCIFGSVFGSLSSIMITRLFGHSALAGQFIILMAIYLYIIEEDFSKEVYRILSWNALCVLCIFIHPYFIGMIGIMLLGSCIRKSFYSIKNIGYSIFTFFSSVFITLIVFYIIGGFQNLSGGNLDGGQLGQASMNLNGFINSMGVAGFFNKLSYGDILFPAEGYNYLGIGIISLLPFVVIYIIKYLINKENKNKAKVVVPVVIMFLLFLIFRWDLIYI